MIKGSKLVGRAVVDMDAAAKLGKIKELIVQPDGERVAGFVVAQAENILGTGGTRRTIPAAALHAIGPDAITVRGAAITEQAATDFDLLPRMSDVIGHKIMTQSGRLLGSIDDILIDGTDGTIIGFVVGEGVKSRLENIFSPDRASSTGYVRADADLQVGNELVVAPDDAFVQGELETLLEDGETVQVRTQQAEAVPHRWAGSAPLKAGGNSLWKKRPAGGGRTGAGSDVEGWIPGDFSQALTGARAETTAAPTNRPPTGP